MNTTLAISHYLHLTKTERYAWQSGQIIDVVGVSVPVWFYKGVSSEPAVEVFCRYRLLTSSEGIIIKHVKDGYEITIPQKPSKEWVPLPDEVWNVLSSQEQEQWYEKNEPEPSLKMLLDIKDGGGQFLAFRQYSKVRKNKKVLNVVHFMEIKDMENLTKTLA